MTVDHLPQPHVDLEEAAEHPDDGIPAAKVNGAVTRAKEIPDPAPAPAPDAIEDWQQSGFGSFP